MDRYESFLAAKAVDVAPGGFRLEPEAIHPGLYPFQGDLTLWALLQGRAALFEDCGLGKTRQQVEWARHVAAYTGRQVLIFAPLAVAPQTIAEAGRIDVDVVYAKDQDAVGNAPLIITNYERLDRFRLEDFSGIVLDESSILKNYVGSTRMRLTEGCARVPFRLCCTATPAPNDHTELGQHSEFLGVLAAHQMLTRFFVHDTKNARDLRLKGHAVEPFWRWVTSWARCVGKPSDLGYSDEGYVLPPLSVLTHVEETDVVTGRGDMLLRQADLSATSVHREKRMTVAARAARVAALVAAEPSEPWVVWCDTDYEADALTAAIPEAVEVRGPHSPERKEAALLDFTNGNVRVLVTKPSIAGWGLNWQHCARMAYVGPTFKYEQFYQTVRRSWRFGQPRAVNAHVVMAQTELAVWNAMLAKAAEHEEMKVRMFAAARAAVQPDRVQDLEYFPRHRAPLPGWLLEVADVAA